MAPVSKRAVICCVDPRIAIDALRHASNCFGGRTFAVTLPGGVKSLIAPLEEARANATLGFLCGEGVTEFILYAHQDCAAYDRSEWDGDSGKEQKHQEGELRAASRILREAFPKIKIIGMFYIDLDEKLERPFGFIPVIE